MSKPAMSLVPVTRRVSSLETADLDVVFQPIVDLETGIPFAHEALTRCKVPEFKSPLVLFERAEQEHCCGRLGRTVREVAFARCPDLPLFVNLHPQELNDQWLVRPDDPLVLHTQEVFLEITESAAIDYFDLCMSVLKEVRSRSGAHLVVDDLGAGYSNLKRIVDIEPDIVKLDIQLTRGIDKKPRQRILVKQVVALCAELGARVVAEGIETLDELHAMRDVGVHFGQGYFLAKPAYPVPAVNWPLLGSHQRLKSAAPAAASSSTSQHYRAAAAR
jgi:EAL domain-containing protein (putative c-di-GMP-specific phosphodiesterase class I)